MIKNSSIRGYLRFGTRIALTLFAWILAIAIMHQLLHDHSMFLAQIFSHLAVKAFAAAIGLSLFIYFIIFSLPNIKPPGWKGVLTIFVWSVLIVIGHGVTHLGESNAREVLSQLQEMMGLGGFILLAGSYSIFLAMPFVAGVEIGLLIMAIFGVPGVIVAYAGTLIGLNLAFGIGRLLPTVWVQKALTKIGLPIGHEDFDALLERFVKGSGWMSKFGSIMLRNRYVTLAVSLNFPGNSLIGGGGGLSLLSGMSQRLVSWPFFVLVTIIATLPIPIFVLFGLLNIDRVVEHSGWFHDFLDIFYGWVF